MMRIRTTMLALVLGVAMAAQAAPHPFYTQMLQRGIASAQQGRDAEAYRELKVAAFGLLGDLPTYQKAQVYLAIVSERLENSDDARIAAVKFLQAERISGAFASLDIPADVRISFEKIAASAADPKYLASIPSFRRSEPREIATVASNSHETTVAEVPDPPPADSAPRTTALTPEPVTEVPGPAPTATVDRTVDRPTANPQTGSTSTTPPVPATNGSTAKVEAARQLLAAADRSNARKAFLALADQSALGRADLLAVGEGLNRLGAWTESSAVYARALPWTDGDEQHIFYEAINRYEMGDRETARTLLDPVVAKLPPSRELAIYRGMIEAGTRVP